MDFNFLKIFRNVDRSNKELTETLDFARDTFFYNYDIMNKDIIITHSNRASLVQEWADFNYFAYSFLYANGLYLDPIRPKQIKEFFNDNIEFVLASKEYNDFYINEREYRAKKNTSNYQLLDPVIEPLLDKVNKIPSVHTFSSCQGATCLKYKEISSLNRWIGNRDYGFEYIFFPSKHSIILDIRFFTWKGLDIQNFISYILKSGFSQVRLDYLNFGRKNCLAMMVSPIKRERFLIIFERYLEKLERVKILE